MLRSDGRRIKVTNMNKDDLAEKLEFGWVVERQLKDGDIVLFNRQPSLHKMSIMAHSVKVLPNKTFRLNPAVCPPYNADFDGDEMNMHALQTEESRAEAKILMQVQENILSPRFGGPIIGGIHDHISGLFLLTRFENHISSHEAYDLLRKSSARNLPNLQGMIQMDNLTGQENRFSARSCLKTSMQSSLPRSAHTVIPVKKKTARMMPM